MNVADFLQEKNVEFDVIPHRDTYDAQRMAQTVHISGKEIAKTVLLRADGAGKYAVAVLPAAKTVDVGRASQALGASRLELATEAEIVAHCADCEIGVLPPFGSQYDMKTIIDESLAEDGDIVFEGNTHHEAIRMKFEDFCAIEQPVVASFAQ